MPAGELWRSRESVSCPYSPECVEEKFCELRNYGVLGRSSMILPGALTRRKGPALANNLSVVRSGYLDGVLALSVCACESTKGLPSLIEVIGVLDGNP
jgi:hypothetical protein